jgi:regulator of nucleoside diphosphate kinase
MPYRLILSALDGARLLQALAKFGRATTAHVRLELTRKIRQAQVRPPSEVPPRIVTMNSRTMLVTDAWREPRECHLVYPEDANCLENRISVLSPLGVQLLGCREGETIQVWTGKRAMRVHLLGLVYQPEAERHWNR